MEYNVFLWETYLKTLALLFYFVRFWYFQLVFRCEDTTGKTRACTLGRRARPRSFYTQ